MKVPLLVFCRLAALNQLAAQGFRVMTEHCGEVAPATAEDVADLLTCLLAAQQRRVDSFRAFRAAFDRLLATGDLPAYNAACKDVGAAFSVQSAEVNATGASLRSAGRADLFEAVRTLQGFEKEQLRLEATLQVLRKAHAEGKWSWQRVGVSLEGVAPRDVRPDWARGAGCREQTAGAAEDAPGCQCCGPEPTEAEYTNALAEATQALQAAVTNINDTLAELREAAADLQQ